MMNATFGLVLCPDYIRDMLRIKLSSHEAFVIGLFSPTANELRNNLGLPVLADLIDNIYEKRI